MEKTPSPSTDPVTPSPNPNAMKDKTLLDEDPLEASPLNLDPSSVDIYNTTPKVGNKGPDQLAESLQTPPTTLFPTEDPVGDVVEDYVPDDLGDIAPELSYPFDSSLPPTPPSGSYSLDPAPLRDAVTPVVDSLIQPFDQASHQPQDDDITHVHSLVSSLLSVNGVESQQISTAQQVSSSLDSSMLPPLSDDPSENKHIVADVYSFVSEAMSAEKGDASFKSHILQSAADKLDDVAPTDLLSSAAQMEEIPALVSSIFPSVLADDTNSNVSTSVESKDPSSSFQDVTSIASSLLSSVLPDIGTNPSELESKGQSSSPPMEDASLLVSASALFAHANANLKSSEITHPGIDASPVDFNNSPVASRGTLDENETGTADRDIGLPLENTVSSSTDGNTNATDVGDTYSAEENVVADVAVQVDHGDSIDNTNEEPAIGDEISSRSLQMPLEGAIANPMEKSTIHSIPMALPSELSASKEEEDINLVASVLADFATDESRPFSAGETSVVIENKSAQFDFSDFMKAAPKVAKTTIDSSPLPPLTWSSPPSKEGDLTENSVVSSLDALPGIGKRSVPAPLEDDGTAGQLTERLSFFTSIARRYVNSGFNIAIIGVAAWSLLAALLALISGHFGLAAGQSVASGGSVYLLRKRKQGASEVLERAHSTVSGPSLGKNELCKKTSELFSASLGQAFDTATTFVASIFTPVSLAIPAFFIGLFEISGTWPTLLIHLGFGVLGLPFLAASLAMYGKARELAVGKAEVMLKPRIDAALLGESSEKTPLIVSAV